MDIVKNGTFSWSEPGERPLVTRIQSIREIECTPNSKSPFLPLDERIVTDGERGPIRLENVQRFQVLAKRGFQQPWSVFGRLAMLEDVFSSSPILEAVLSATGGKAVNAYDFFFIGVHHRDDGKRKSIVVAVRVTVPQLGEA